MRKQLETSICAIVGFLAGCCEDSPAAPAACQHWRRPRMLDWLAQTGRLLVMTEPEFSLSSSGFSNAASYRVCGVGAMDPFHSTSDKLCTVGALAGTCDDQCFASAIYVEPRRCCSPAAGRRCSVAAMKPLYVIIRDFTRSWYQRALLLCQLRCALSRSICPA